jgi:hypothetical protein
MPTYLPGVKNLTYLFTFLIICFCFYNCSKSPDPIPESGVQEEPIPTPEEEPVEPTSEVYFTIDILPSFAPFIGDNWLIIHNDNGELLDFRQYEIGDQLVFETSSTELATTESLTITNLDIGNVGQEIYALRTYAEVKKGSVWNFKTPINDVPDPIEDDHEFYNLSIINATSIRRYNVQSSKYGLNADSFYSQNAPIIERTYVLQKNHTYLLAIEDVNGSLKYLFFNTSENETNIDLDYDQFLAYDYILETELPDYSQFAATTRGHNSMNFDDVGYDLDSKFYFNSETLTSKLGFIDGLESYATELEIQMGKIRYGYFKYGSDQPQQIDVISNPIFEIENSSILDFRFSTEVNFVRQRSFWKYPVTLQSTNNVNILWTLFSESNSIKLNPFPDELLSSYPKLDIANLQLNYTQLYTISNSQSEWLESFVAGDNSLNSLEWVKINN